MKKNKFFFGNIKTLFVLVSFISVCCTGPKTEKNTERRQDTIAKTDIMGIRPVKVRDSLFYISNEILSNGIKIGSSDAEVRSRLDGRCIISEVSYSEADGYYYQQWNYEGLGLVLLMQSRSSQGNWEVSEITIENISDLKTSSGIGIGTPRAQIYTKHADHIDNRESDAEKVLVGSVYEGILFSIENDTVSAIFIGAMAE